MSIYSKIPAAKPPPSKLRLVLKGEANKCHGYMAGFYILQEDLVNTFPYWNDKSGKNSIWFVFGSGNWKVGYTSNLGLNLGAIMGPYGD